MGRPNTAVIMMPRKIIASTVSMVLKMKDLPLLVSKMTTSWAKMTVAIAV